MLENDILLEAERAEESRSGRLPCGDGIAIARLFFKHGKMVSMVLSRVSVVSMVSLRERLAPGRA